MIAIYLCKQQALYAEQQSNFKTQQSKFIGNLDGNATMFFILEEVKETAFGFSQNTVRVL